MGKYYQYSITAHPPIIQYIMEVIRMQENGFLLITRLILSIVNSLSETMHPSSIALTRVFQHGMIIGTDLALARVEC